MEEQYTTKEKHNKEIQVNYKRKINIIHSIYNIHVVYFQKAGLLQGAISFHPTRLKNRRRDMLFCLSNVSVILKAQLNPKIKQNGSGKKKEKKNNLPRYILSNSLINRTVSILSEFAYPTKIFPDRYFPVGAARGFSTHHWGRNC